MVAREYITRWLDSQPLDVRGSQPFLREPGHLLIAHDKSNHGHLGNGRMVEQSLLQA